MTRSEALSLAPAAIEKIKTGYGMEDYVFTAVNAHEGGRNLVYSADGGDRRIVRFSYLPDRTAEDYAAECEFNRFLRDNGAPVAGVLPDKQGNYVARCGENGKTLTACVFERAKGDSLYQHGYRYRDGAPLDEYFYNSGKTLGKLHAASKLFRPVHPRRDFFELYNLERIDAAVPETRPELRNAIRRLIDRLAKLPRDAGNYGCVHFDYGDGNYNIDYATGEITVFDFDNACRFFYMFDLAGVWRNGVGWIRSEPDAEKRRRFMDDYFATAVKGYRSATELSDDALARLPLFIDAVLMEGIVDELECNLRDGEEDGDGELDYPAACLIERHEYMGLFDGFYDAERPFDKK